MASVVSGGRSHKKSKPGKWQLALFFNGKVTKPLQPVQGVSESYQEQTWRST
jgi:hypothetical protein